MLPTLFLSSIVFSTDLQWGVRWLGETNCTISWYHGLINRPFLGSTHDPFCVTSSRRINYRNEVQTEGRGLVNWNIMNYMYG